MSDYRQLTVWKKTDLLAAEVYAITAGFPRNEQFGITSQLRRAALSVPTNIVEGNSRISPGDKKRFFDIAYASLMETHYLIDFAVRLGYIECDCESLDNHISEARKMLIALKRSI